MKQQLTDPANLPTGTRHPVLVALPRQQPGAPLIVSRFDVAMEPVVEEEPVLTIGAIAEDGQPVALLLAPEARAKVAGWLTPTETAAVTVYRAVYEHEPFPLGLYSNAAAARAHCEDLVRQEWTPSAPLVFEWSVDEDDQAVTELDVRVETDSWSTGYTVTAVVADAEYDPDADA